MKLLMDRQMHPRSENWTPMSHQASRCNKKYYKDTFPHPLPGALCAKPEISTTIAKQFENIYTFAIRFSICLLKFFGAARWWLHNIATALLARLYDNIFAATGSSAAKRKGINSKLFMNSTAPDKALFLSAE